MDAGTPTTPRVPAAGLTITVHEATVSAERAVSVRFTLKDARNQNLTPDDVTQLGFVLGEVVQDAAGAPLRYRALTTTAAAAPHAATQQSGMEYAVRSPTVARDRLTANADGSWTYRLSTALPTTYSPSRTLTLGIQTRRPGLLAADPETVVNATHDWVPGGGTPQTIAIAAEASCNSCHGQLSAHGGGRRSLALCIRCHTEELVDPDTRNNLEMGLMVHRIHRGAALPSVVGAPASGTTPALPGVPYRIVGYAGTVFDFSTVGYPQDIRNCEKCHAPSQRDAGRWATRPSIAQCTSCHDRTHFTTGPVPAGWRTHAPGVVVSESECGTCHRESGGLAGIRDVHMLPQNRAGAPTLAARIDRVTDVAPGTAPLVEFTLTDRGGAAIPAATALSSLSFLMNGPTRPAYGLFPALRASALGTSAVGTLTTVGAGRYTYRFPTTMVVPAGSAGTWAVGIEAQRTETITPAVGTTPAVTFRHGAVNPVQYVAIGGGTAAPRPRLVDINRCNNCHSELALHGRNRINNVDYCAMCHNPGATDVARRPAGTPGAPESVDFGPMIHRIHMGEHLPSVQAGTPYIIYGNGNRANDFSHVRFPQALTNCAACHVDNTQNNATAAACTSCHNSMSARAHAQLNTTSTGAEACNACHGAGRTFAVSASHPAGP